MVVDPPVNGILLAFHEQSNVTYGPPCSSASQVTLIRTASVSITPPV